MVRDCCRTRLSRGRRSVCQFNATTYGCDGGETNSCKTTKRNRACGGKSKLPDHHGTRGRTVYTTLGNTRSYRGKRTESGEPSNWSTLPDVRSCSEKRSDHKRWENGGFSIWSACRDSRS